MIKCFLLCGIPGSGKSTWAKIEVAKDPDNWVRINNDDLRAMMNNSVWSSEYEKLISDTRNYLIRDAMKRNKNVIVDNLNLNRRHFDDVCKMAKVLNKNIQVLEKHFYIELEEAIARDAKRVGSAKVGESVILKWWEKSGKKQFKHYKSRVEVFQENSPNSSIIDITPVWDDNLKTAIICDLDGTLALINGRNPYDATDCDVKDLPNIPVIETVKLFYQSGSDIIFCSGREDKYREATERFIQKHCTALDATPIDYKLFMRKTGDFRKDVIIKEEIYNNEIKGKYNVRLVLDDRSTVVEFWRKIGLTCFQVAFGNF